MNDSFVDFDVLGEVDPVSLDVLRPSLYALDRLGSAQGSRRAARSADRLGGAAQPAGLHGGAQPPSGRREARELWPGGSVFGRCRACGTGSSTASCFRLA